MPEADRRLPYQPSIDGMRAVSIAAVMLFHACALAGLPDWFRGGFLGVTVFFVVSGYLITTLLLRESATTGTVRLTAFWARRARRLAPASLTVVAACVVLGSIPDSPWPGFRATDAMAGVWGVMNWHLIALGTEQVVRGLGPLSPYWSLAIEEQFYVVLAVTMALVVRTASPVRAIGVAFAAVWVTSLAVASIFELSPITLEFSLLHRSGELATGGLLAVAAHRRPTLFDDAAPISRWSGPASLLALAVLFGAAGFEPPWLLRGGFLVVAAIAAVLLVAAHSAGPVRTVLSHRVVVRVGLYSYALYLVHWPIGLLVNARTSIDGWPSVAIQLIGSSIAAVVLHRAVEQPLRYRAAAADGTTLKIWGASSVAVSVLAVVLLG